MTMLPGGRAGISRRIRLADIAPRLARARDQYVAELRQAKRDRQLHREIDLELERIVAHRDLQLARAYATGSSRYIARRQHLLAEAHQRLATFRAREAA